MYAPTTIVPVSSHIFVRSAFVRGAVGNDSTPHKRRT
jgi:hypothetical protein